MAAGLTALRLRVGAVVAAVAAAAAAGASGARAAGAAKPDRPPQRPQAYAPVATADIGRIDVAVRAYASERAGRLPVSLEDLVAEKNAEGRAFLSEVPLDPWGRPYSYAVTSSRLGAYDLRSYGPDTLPGTDDDVVAAPVPVPID